MIDINCMNKVEDIRRYYKHINAELQDAINVPYLTLTCVLATMDID